MGYLDETIGAAFIGCLLTAMFAFIHAVSLLLVDKCFAQFLRSNVFTSNSLLRQRTARWSFDQGFGESLQASYLSVRKLTKGLSHSGARCSVRYFNS